MKVQYGWMLHLWDGIYNIYMLPLMKYICPTHAKFHCSLLSQTHFRKKREGSCELHIQAVSHWNTCCKVRTHSERYSRSVFTAPVVVEKMS